MPTILAAAKAVTPFGVQASRTTVEVNRDAEDLAVTFLNVGGTPISFAMSGGHLHAYIAELIECANAMAARRLHLQSEFLSWPDLYVGGQFDMQAAKAAAYGFFGDDEATA